MLDFDKGEFLSAVRQVLWGVANWTKEVFDAGAARRLLELGEAEEPPSIDIDGTWDWARPGCLGPRVEASLCFQNLDRMYDFVTTGEWAGDEEELDEVIHELTPIAHVIEDEVLLNAGGAALIPSAARQKVRLVLEHMAARDRLRHNEPLELRQVALLAGLAEKTVRMAAMRTGEGPELHTFRKDNRTLVEPQEALRWLSTKRNFRPTRIRDRDTVQTILPTNLAQLQWVLRSLRARAGLSVEELASRLAWDGRTSREYENLEKDEQTFDPTLLSVSHLIALGQVLGLSDPKAFARAAARVLAELAIERELAAATTQ